MKKEIIFIREGCMFRSVVGLYKDVLKIVFYENDVVFCGFIYFRIIYLCFLCEGFKSFKNWDIIK